MVTFGRKELASGAIIALSGMFAQTAQADLLVYEGFQNTEVGGTLGGETVGDGLTGTWNGYDGSNRLDIAAGSLTYGALETSGNQVYKDAASNGRTAAGAALGSTLSGAGVMDHGASVWVSFLFAQPVDSSNNKLLVYLSSDNVTGAGSMSNSGSAIGIEIDDNKLHASTFVSGSESVSGNSNVAHETTHLAVMEIVWGADGASSDTLNIYLPDTDLVLGSAVLTHTAVIDQSLIDTLVIGGKEDAPNIDEIRIGESYADVTPVPEPGSLALIGLGGLLIARRRRD